MNKLVRDKIPEILKKRNKVVKVVQLSEHENLAALYDKLIEEAVELKNADEAEVVEEIADIEEVLSAIIETRGLKTSQIEDTKIKKLDQVGGFAQRLFLLDSRPIKKWVGISGSWRYQDNKVEEDVRRVVKDLLTRENGIITGGALGVDYWATDEVLKRKSWNRLRIVLPTTLDVYSRHYLQRASEGVITQKQATQLINQLELVKKKKPTRLN